MLTPTNRKESPVVKVDTDVAASSVIKWLTGQSFNNVLLLLMFGSFGWGMHYSVTVAIPGHLKTIQEGYKSLDAAHHAERKQLVETYDKWYDRLDQRMRAMGSFPAPGEESATAINGN